jgi:hypothetical protein
MIFSSTLMSVQAHRLLSCGADHSPPRSGQLCRAGRDPSLNGGEDAPNGELPQRAD